MHRSTENGKQIDVSGMLAGKSFNGAAGLVLQSRGRVIAVVGMTVVGDHIAAIDLLIDPEKLATLEALPD